MSAKEYAASIEPLTGATEEAHERYLRWHLEKAFEAGEKEWRKRALRAEAIANAGHADECGGMNPAAGECACGWLQRTAAATYIEQLEAALEITVDSRDILMREKAK